MANSLQDLASAIEEEEAAASEIPVSSLTDFEKKALQAQGIDLTGPTVRVRKTAPKKLSPVQPAQEAAKTEMVKKLESPANVPVKEEAPAPVAPPAPTFTKEDAQEFVRCLLSLKPFKKTYKTMGDNVQVTFSSRTAQENMILSTILRDLRLRHGSGNLDVINVAWLAFQFCYTASQVVIGGKVIEIKKPAALDYEDIKANVAEVLQQLPLPIYKAVISKLLSFELVVAELEAKADDPNFWDLTDA